MSTRNDIEVQEAKKLLKIAFVSFIRGFFLIENRDGRILKDLLASWERDLCYLNSALNNLQEVACRELEQ